MPNYRLFEKTSQHSRKQTEGSKETLPPTQDSLPPSPADDPLDVLARNNRALGRGLKEYTSEVEDTGNFDVSKAGLKVSGVPRWATGIFGVVVALALLAVAVAYAVKMLK